MPQFVLIIASALIIASPIANATAPRCEALEPAEQSTTEIRAGGSLEFVANCIDADGDWTQNPYSATWKIDQKVWSEDSPIDPTTESWVTRMTATFAEGDHVVDLTIRDAQNIEYGSRWFVRAIAQPAASASPVPSPSPTSQARATPTPVPSPSPAGSGHPPPSPMGTSEEMLVPTPTHAAAPTSAADGDPDREHNTRTETRASPVVIALLGLALTAAARRR